MDEHQADAVKVTSIKAARKLSRVQKGISGYSNISRRSLLNVGPGVILSDFEEFKKYLQETLDLIVLLEGKF